MTNVNNLVLKDTCTNAPTFDNLKAEVWIRWKIRTLFPQRPKSVAEKGMTPTAEYPIGSSAEYSCYLSAEKWFIRPAHQPNTSGTSADSPTWKSAENPAGTWTESESHFRSCIRVSLGPSFPVILWHIFCLNKSRIYLQCLCRKSPWTGIESPWNPQPTFPR